MQSQTHPLAKTTALLAFGVLLALTGCSKKDDTTNATAASAAEATAAPMSAAPADDKGTPMPINEDTAALDAGPDVAASSSAAATGNEATAMDASGDNAMGNEPLEGAADNSGMDKISENDQVIDNEPASPNAPRATDDANSNGDNAMGNAKVGN